MRTILVAVLATVILAACGNNPRKTATSDPQSDGVEVLCFHGAQRCVTCTAIENGAKEVVDTYFAKQIEDEMEYPGQVRVVVIRESRAVDVAK